MEFTGPAAERLAVRERLESYADAVFRRDAEAWAACWAPDAVWNLSGEEVRGLTVIVAAWEAAMAPFSHALFFVVPGAIVVSGDTALARSFTNEILVLAAGGTRRLAGRYDDELVRQGAACASLSAASPCFTSSPDPPLPGTEDADGGLVAQATAQWAARRSPPPAPAAQAGTAVR